MHKQISKIKAKITKKINKPKIKTDFFVVGVMDKFWVKVGLHQGSALSPFLFAMVMDRLTDEIRQESLWTMIFADDL